MKRSFIVALAFVLTTVPARAQAPAPAHEVTQDAIDKAIDRGVAHLLELYADGQGRNPRQLPGMTMSLNDRPGLRALTVYTLLKSGVDARNAVVENLLAHLAFERFNGTYDVACMLLALTAYDPIGQRAWIDELAAFLLAHRENPGDFGYPGGGDLSNTQYGALGLRAAASVGVTIPKDVWIDLVHATLRYQESDGGFVYTVGDHAPRATMTAAGVGTLAICEIELARTNELTPDVADLAQTAESRGLAWLAQEGDVERVAAGIGWLHYYLYGLERIGALCGVDKIGERDWYKDGAAYLVAHQDASGEWNGTFERAPTLFALLFLRRATAHSGSERPSTGPRPRRFPHTEGTDVPGAMRLEVQGTRPARMWLRALVSPKNGPLEWPDERGHGPRVVRVEYVCDGAIVAVSLGDPEHACGEHAFVAEANGLALGKHRVQAFVHVRLPETKRADADKKPAPEAPAFHELVITSNSVDVEVTDDATVAPTAPAFAPELDLVTRARPRAKASSTIAHTPGFEPGMFNARNAVDGNPRTPWIAAQNDAEPTLHVTLQDPQRANRLRIAPAHIVPRDPDFLTQPREVRVSIDAGPPRVLALSADQSGWLELRLEKMLTIHTLEFRLVGRQVASATVGIGEIALELTTE